MSVAPEVRAAEAQRFLDGHFGRSVRSVELVGEGYWSRCYGFRLDDGELVVRFGAHVEDFERDRLAATWAGPGLPVPEVLAIVEGPGGYAAISTRSHGVPLETLDERGWREVLPSLLSVLDAARRVDLSTATGFGEWGGDSVGTHDSWPAFLRAAGDDSPSHRVHGWRSALAASSVGEATFLAGLARLDELAEAGPGTRHLIHADLLNRNVLVEGARVQAVFDWGSSLYGDHLYDLASLVFWSAWYPALRAVDIATVALAHLGDLGAALDGFEDRLLACQLHIAVTNLGYSAFVANDAVAWIHDRLAELL